MKVFPLYLLNVLGGTLLTLFLLTLVCNHFQFDSKSAICVYLYGTMGYFVKAIFFFTPYFGLNIGDYSLRKSIRRLIIWSPFLLFFMWFTMIIAFQIDLFFTDIEFGYISRFPHFIVQLLVALIGCVGNAVFANIKYNKK